MRPIRVRASIEKRKKPFSPIFTFWRMDMQPNAISRGCFRLHFVARLCRLLLLIAHFICRTWSVYTFSINLIRCYLVSDVCCSRTSQTHKIAHDCVTRDIDLYHSSMWNIFAYSATQTQPNTISPNIICLSSKKKTTTENYLLLYIFFSLLRCKSFNEMFKNDHRLAAAVKCLPSRRCSFSKWCIFNGRKLTEKVAHYWHLFACARKNTQKHKEFLHAPKKTRERKPRAEKRARRRCVWHLNAIKCACRQMQAQ